MNARQIVLASRPRGAPTADNFRMETTALADLQDGEVLVQGLFYSVDPYMRGRMNDAPSYVPAFQIGQPIEGSVVAKVLHSNAGSFTTGDLVTGRLPWRTHAVTSAKELQKIDTDIALASWYLGILGMTGMTAYFGLMDIGKPKTGETVVVSGAAGAVGLVVGQIAKVQGCRVVGIAGSDAKVKLLKAEFGFDEAINYKTTPDLKNAVARACPKGVDIYFDNVGGEISDAVITNLNSHARIPLCGQISLYNSTETPLGPRLQPLLLQKSALMQGFLVFSYQHRFPEGIGHLVQWLKEKKVKNSETVMHGFDQLPRALLSLFTGDNTGKMIVEA